jgi:hypothetical protein
MPDDVKLNAKVRKLVIANWLDISQIRTRVTRGVISFQGHVQRLGEDPRAPESNEPFLCKLDEQIRMLPGFRGAHYAFDNWRRAPTGAWLFTGRKPRSSRKSR